jgi:hypothetical protein
MLLSGFGALGFDRFCGLRRGKFCRSNLADLDRLGELFEIFGTLVGIGDTEAGDCLVELIAVAPGIPRWRKGRRCGHVLWPAVRRSSARTAPVRRLPNPLPQLLPCDRAECGQWQAAPKNWAKMN